MPDDNKIGSAEDIAREIEAIRQQYASGSKKDRAMKFFVLWADSHAVDPLEMMNSVYPDETGWDSKEVERLRGLSLPDFPTAWDQTCIEDLVESLGDLNYHSLAQAARRRSA